MGSFDRGLGLVGCLGLSLFFSGALLAEPQTAPMDPGTFEITTGPVVVATPDASEASRPLGASANTENRFLTESPLGELLKSHSSDVSSGEIAESVVPREGFSLVLPPGGNRFRMNAKSGKAFELIPGRLWGKKEHPSLRDRYNFNGPPLFYPTDEVSIVSKTQGESLMALVKRMELPEECIRELVHYFAESYPSNRPELGQIPTLLSYYRDVFDPALSYLDFRIAEIKESAPFVPPSVKPKKSLFFRRPANLPENPMREDLKSLEKARKELVESLSSRFFWLDSIKDAALKVCVEKDGGRDRSVSATRVMKTLSDLEDFFFTKLPSGKTWQELMNETADLDKIAKGHKSQVKSEIFSKGEKQLREIYFHFYDFNEKVALLEIAHSAVKQAAADHAAAAEAVKSAQGLGAKLQATKANSRSEALLAEANSRFLEVREQAFFQCLMAVKGLEDFQVPGLRTERAPEHISTPKITTSLPGADSIESYNQNVLKPIQDKTKELYALLKMASVNELNLNLDMTKLFFNKHHCEDMTQPGAGKKDLEGFKQINIAYREMTRVLLELRQVGEVVDALSQKSEYEMNRVFAGAQQPFSEAVRRMELQESLSDPAK